jgi:hypothetical protein
MNTRETTIDVFEDIDPMSLEVFLEIFYPEYNDIADSFYREGKWLGRGEIVQTGDVLTMHIHGQKPTCSLPEFVAGEIAAYKDSFLASANERYDRQVMDALLTVAPPLAFTNLTNPKENPMENITPVQTMTLVNGHDISRKSDDDLINDIRRMEADIKSLREIRTVSRAVAKKAEDIAEALKATVTELDSRYPAEAVDAGAHDGVGV